MNLVCPHCRKTNDIFAAQIGEVVDCLFCGKPFTVAKSKLPPLPSLDEPPEFDDPIFGAPTPRQHAGQPPIQPPVIYQPLAAPHRAYYVPDKKSAGLAAILSFFWPGLGQIYNGQVGKAMALMVAWPLALASILVAIFQLMDHAKMDTASYQNSVLLIRAITAILWLVVIALNVWDAHTEAEKINRRHRREYGQ